MSQAGLAESRASFGKDVSPLLPHGRLPERRKTYLWNLKGSLLGHGRLGRQESVFEEEAVH